MNILLVNYEYPPLGGGAGNATMFIARGLLQLGHRAFVLTSRFGQQPAEALEDGVIVHRVRALRRAADRSDQLQMTSFMLAAVVASRSLVRRHCIDAVIAFFTIPSAPAAWWLQRTRGLPYVVSLRGGDVPGHVPGLARVHRILTPVRRAILSRAVAVVANSTSLANRSQRADPVPVTVIPNGVDTDFFRPATSGTRSSAAGFRVLFVGRVHAEKNVDFLLEAVAALDAPDRDRVRIDIVGDGPARPQLRKLAATLGLDERVTWHGWRTKQEVAALYREVDCLANPSSYEGMPNAVLEAMASALPVIASDVGGNNEVVRSGETGLLFALRDVNALRGCLKTLLCDRQLCARMGEQGRAVVLANYSWRAAAEHYAALLETSGSAADGHATSGDQFDAAPCSTSRIRSSANSRRCFTARARRACQLPGAARPAFS